MRHHPLRRLASWLLPAIALVLSACGSGTDDTRTLANYGDVRDRVDALSLELESLADTFTADDTATTALNAVMELQYAYPLGADATRLSRGTYVFDEATYGYEATADAVPSPFDLQIVGSLGAPTATVLIDWDRDGVATRELTIDGDVVEVPRNVRLVVREGGNEIGRVDASGEVSTREDATCGTVVQVESLDIDAQVGSLGVDATLATGPASSFEVSASYGGYGLTAAFDVDVDASALATSCVAPRDADLPTRVSASLELEVPSGRVGASATVDDLVWTDGVPTAFDVSASLANDGETAATLAGSVAIDSDTGEATHDVIAHFADSDIGLDALIEELAPAP